MASGSSVNIMLLGGEQLEKKLNPKDTLRPGVKHLFDKSTMLIKRQVMTYSPVQYGVLRASWQASVDAAMIPLWGKVGTNVLYALPLEERGKQGKAHPRGVGRIPFLEPAAADTKDKWMGWIGEAAVSIEKEFDSR